MDWINLINFIFRCWIVICKIVKKKYWYIYINSVSYILVNIVMLLKVNLKNWLSNKESIWDVIFGKLFICIMYYYVLYI